MAAGVAAAGLMVLFGVTEKRLGGGDQTPKAVARAQGNGGRASSTATRAGSISKPAQAAPHLVASPIGVLPAPLQDAAVAALGNQVYAFGGLTATQASAATVSRISTAGVSSLAPLPTPLHDASATAVGGRLYILGGGQSVSYSGIGRYDPGSGGTDLVGALPTPLSDLSTATIGSTTYVVGGFSGTVFSNRILAYGGGRSARVVGHLPRGLRYAAVAAVGGRLVIAGGRTQAGATAAVLSFDPVSGRTTQIGRLPQPLMHASAGAIGETAYVVGGQTAAGRPTSWVLAIDSASHVRRVLHLARPLSDAGVATTPNGLVVVGGWDGRAPVDRVWLLHTSTSKASAHGPPAMFRGPLPGDLLIADRGNNRMLIVNPVHRILWKFPNRPGQVHLYFDDDTFFAPGGRRIISNQEENHQIIEISYPSGKLIWSYGHPGVAGSSPGYLNTPDDAYALPHHLVIVADAYNCRVLELRGNRIVRSIGQAGHCAHDPPRYLGPVNGDTPLPNHDILVSEINGSYLDEFTLSGRLVRVYKAPVTYPSDPQLTLRGNILLADYTSPGAVVILSRRTGRLLWRYRVTTGPGMLDHPSLAAMLPNGMIALNDDYNQRIVIIDPRTNKIVWTYGHLGRPGAAPGYLNTPDGFQFIPVTASGQPDPARIWPHGRLR
ncbi:MAG: kelch repeat-containing protein [Gaiellales bacterium]